MKKPDLLDQFGTYYVTNDCDVRKDVSVANLNAKKKWSFFSISSRANKIIQQTKAINYSNYTNMKTILSTQISLFVTLKNFRRNIAAKRTLLMLFKFNRFSLKNGIYDFGARIGNVNNILTFY